MTTRSGPGTFATHADYASLRTQVNNVSSEQQIMRGEISRISENMVTKSEMDNIARHIDVLSNKIGDSSKTNWGVIFAGAALAASVFGSIWIAGITPIQHTQEELHAEILKLDNEHRIFEKEVAATLNMRNGLFLSVREHDEFKKRIDDKIDQSIRQLEKIETIMLRLLETKK